jgi:lipoprotein-releasing system ATP-binding protein
MNDNSYILRAENLSRVYHQGENSLTVFQNLSLSIQRGEIVALVGSSGSGKSTLLHALGLLDRPTAGEIFLNDSPAHNASDESRTKLRRNHLGFIYQFHFLQPEFSALENVIIPQLIKGVSKYEAVKAAQTLLDSVGLSHRYDHRPARLSGGEQQRVAIARALANNPSLILADEPTGNLDPATADDVFSLLMKRVRDGNSAAFIATHNPDLARRMDRILYLKNGILSEGA